MLVPGACGNCSNSLPAGSRFCGACGHPVESLSSLPTEHSPLGARAAAGPTGHSSFSTVEARFLPGVVLAGRYRIVGLLGRGGMGEVYRADDLKLGQAVALKFLPPGFEANPDRLKRFLDEVRTARQVTHTNVCRIYDAGEAEGQHFLSMEYVDGEDLASLLRRIGHLPKDKAIQIARQLCAGLAASHEIGVLHRDLKPANVMIDGRGRVRITDFGLAGFASRIAGTEILAGTPGYMAPEQLAGREVSVRSDIYSLGLVLYEVFTGKPAFKATSVEEQRRMHSETTPSSPSSFMEGFDPVVERVLLRCLEADPARRPSSALAVAAALPGGDPLAAALAAGETPSPEMVAEAGAKGATTPWVAWSALGIFLAALVGCIMMAPRSTLLGIVPLDKPPEFLQERAREILKLAGRVGVPGDSLFTFEANNDYLEDLSKRKLTDAERRQELRSSPPSGMTFWYRQSPRELARLSAGSMGNWISDPPNLEPGMARVGLDPDGRLQSLLVVPAERTGPDQAAGEPDWNPLLSAAGIEAKEVVPVQPEWAPPVYADRRSAWTGTWTSKPDVPLRIEAASAGGRPVSFRIIAPWTQAKEESAPSEDFALSFGLLVGAIAFVAVIVTAGLVALRNVRRGRGDRRGALRFGLFLGAIRMTWFLGAHHLASTAEIELFIAHLSYAMQRVGLGYVFYLAIEPYVRRLWPRMLVTWVRALEGRFRDPLVGRDLLVGSAAGALCSLLPRLLLMVFPAVAGDLTVPQSSLWSLEALRGPTSALVAVMGIQTTQLFGIFMPVVLLLIFRLLLRHTVPAVLAVTLLTLVMFNPGSKGLLAYVLSILLGMTIGWTVLFRFGLLASAFFFTVISLIEDLPLVPHPAAWYLGSMLLALAFVTAPALWGFWTSQAGRPLFRESLLEPEALR